MNWSDLIFHVIIFALILSVEFRNGAAQTSQAKEVIHLIRNGLKQQPAHPSGEATILIGLTGAGKTTLAKFITSDNDRLVSVAVPGKPKTTPCANKTETASSTDYNDYDSGSPECESVEVAKQYYIQDLNDDKIGNDITKSRTFYPDIYDDIATGDVVVDCPGFADTRSEVHEIAIGVFMKHIFKWAKKVKILVVVNHADVTRTGDRNAIRNLLRFVTVLLKNYGKFNSSVGLVATKAANEYNSNHQVIGDDAMIEQIADFLTTVHGELVADDPTDIKVQVLNTLLKQTGNRYPNIGIFRRIYEEGPLQQIAAVQRGKKKIRKMMLKNLKYANFYDSDVGFAISPASEAVVVELCELIKSKIDLLLGRLHANFTGHYEGVIRDFQSYAQLSETLKRDSGLLQPFYLYQNATLEEQLDWFVDVLKTNLSASYVKVKSSIESIRVQTNYLDYLKGMTSNPKVKPNESWKTQTKSLVQHVEGLADWYAFLMSIFERLAQQDFQSKKETFNHTTIKHWPLFKSFLHTNLMWSTSNSVINRTSLEEHEQRSLEDVLHMLIDSAEGRFQQPSLNTCELIIEGPFVRLSDFEKFAPLCGNRSITAAYLFSHHTLFIDANLTEIGSEMLLSFVAPKWVVIGKPTINLSGKPGRDLSQSNTGHGEAGFAGGPSGTFFGVVSDFTNSASLEIVTNGGKGGNGQMGMNGKDGHGDVEPNKVHDKACSRSLFHTSASCLLRSPTYFKIDGIDYEMKQTDCTQCLFCCPAYDVEFRILDGPSATIGYDGGKQGLGGKRSTSSQIIELNERSAVKIRSQDGLPGAEGQGGRGGLGAIKNGVYFEDILLSCNVLGLTGIDECRNLGFQPGTRQASAQNGLNNRFGIQLQPKSGKHYDFYAVITKYRLFIAKLRFQNAKSIDNLDLEFLESITRNTKIQNMTDLHQLSEEFLALEKIVKHYPDMNRWIYFLGTLMQNIEVARQRQPNSTAFAIATHYLKTAILSRKLSIEYQSDKNLIVDVNLFLNEVSNQIAKLAGLNHEARLKALKSIYIQDIITKQQKADQFLNQQYSSEMGMIESKINKSISGLQAEIENLLAQLLTDRNTYDKLIEEAQRKLKLNMAFKCLKTGSQFALITSPKIALTGQVFEVGQLDSAPDTKIAAAVRTLKNFNRKFDAENENKIRLLESKFHNLTSADPMEQLVLDGAKAKLADLVKKTFRFSIIQTELSTTIEKLRRDQNITDSELLDRVLTSIYLTEPSYAASYENLHRATQNAPAEFKSSPLKQGMIELEASIKKVASYELFVEDSLRLYLKNLTKLMHAIKDGAHKSSAIPLEISRFNVHAILIEVRSIINKFTTGFGANEELIMCIDMLDNWLRTTINIYEQIELYNDQKKLGNLIVGLNEIGLKRLNTNDERLDAIIRKLDHRIVSNTIQNQYIRVVQTFQQLVFPFAPLFSAAIRIPESEHDSTKDDDLMQLTMSKIATLQSKINDLQSSVINGYDEKLFSFNFDEQQPFYAWNEVQHEEKIDALLRGDEVVFSAKIFNSAGNAVKFRDIRLKLIATIASEQHQLDSYLNSTHIRLTHAGNSQYKCDGRFFVISHQQQLIEMSAASDERGDPVSSNAVYKKIRDGNILLSPYALWKLQIVHRFRDTLMDLDHLFGKVQLMLVGKGQYIKENNPICDQALEEFYQLDQIDEQTVIND